MHTEKIRIYPNKTQRELIDNTLYECKCFYNYILQCHWDMYATCKIGPKKYDYDQFYEVYPGPKKYMSSRARQNVEARLEDAFKRWFDPKLRNRKPKFKSLKDYRSFTVNTVNMGFKILKNKIQVIRIGQIKARITRPILGIPKSCSVKKMRSGKYYVFIVVDDKDVNKSVVPLDRQDNIGVDLGMKTFAQLSDGQFIKKPKFISKRERKLVSKAHRNMSRKKYGSNNYEKSRLRFARRHEHFANKRLDHHFKVAHWLVTHFKTIVCEDLTISTMFQGKFQNNQRRVLKELSLYIFLVTLEHMCNKYSSTLLKVEPYNTTQNCCVCGTTVPKTLGDRMHICPVCGLTVDRDLNAALNILHKGVGGRSTTGTVGSIMLVEVEVPGLEHKPEAKTSTNEARIPS